MSKIEGGLGKCFDNVRSVIPDEGPDVYGEALEALDNIEDAFERRQRWAHEARALAMRLQGMLGEHIAWMRELASADEPPDEVTLKARADGLETQMLAELGNMGLSKLPPKALVELGVAVAAELERRGITAFPVVLGVDGKIQGGVPEDG